MSLKDQLTSFIVQTFVERPAKKRGLSQLIDKLERSGQTLNTKFAQTQGNAKHQEKLNHIIAIERWGQNRLRVALGTPYKEDDNQAYQPVPEASWQELQTLFTQTRQETLEIAQTIETQDVDTSAKVPHNQMGPMSLLAWLRYLEVHASLEAKRIN